MRYKTWEIVNSKIVSALISNVGIFCTGYVIIRVQHERRMKEIETQAEHFRNELRRQEMEALRQRVSETTRLAEQVLEHTRGLDDSYSDDHPSSFTSKM